MMTPEPNITLTLTQTKKIVINIDPEFLKLSIGSYIGPKKAIRGLRIRVRNSLYGSVLKSVNLRAWSGPSTEYLAKIFIFFNTTFPSSVKRT